MDFASEQQLMHSLITSRLDCFYFSSYIILPQIHLYDNPSNYQEFQLYILINASDAKPLLRETVARLRKREHAQLLFWNHCSCSLLTPRSHFNYFPNLPYFPWTTPVYPRELLNFSVKMQYKIWCHT